jgi:ribosomal protein S18 acetylase RimI-like enzyme
VIRHLTPLDIDAYIQLRREALVLDPFAFSASQGTDQAQSPPVLQKILSSQDEAIVGAFEPELAGIAGVYRERAPKNRHRSRIWGVYVTPAHRGKGLGEALLRDAVEFARGTEGVRQIHLSVADGAAAALALYRKMGFEVWGTEPAALQVGGVFVAEHHMVMVLDAHG